MDGDPVEGEPSEVKTLGETFSLLCPQYMAMGMTYDEFWYGNPSMVRAYRKAWEIKQRAEEAGISATTLNRAKQRCGRNSKRISKGLTVWL